MLRFTLILLVTFVAAAGVWAGATLQSAMGHLENGPGFKHSINIADLVRKATMERKQSRELTNFEDFIDRSSRDFNFKRLYNSNYLKELPNGFKGRTLLGRNRARDYFIGFSDNSFNKTPAPSFGDSAAEAGLLRVDETKVGDPSYRLYGKAKFNAAHVSHQNLFHYIKGLGLIIDPTYIEKINRPDCNHYPKLNPESRKLLADFCYNFPRMAAKMARYGGLKSMFEVKEYKGKKYTRLNFVGVPKMANLKADYPEIHDYLEGLEDVGYVRMGFRNTKGRLLSRFIMDSDTLTIRFETNIADGKVIPIDSKGVPNFSDSVDLTTFKRTGGYASVYTRLKVYGLVIEARNITAGGSISRSPKGARFYGRLGKKPNIEFSGRFWHILPPWLIDFGMPGDMQTLGDNFFATLAEANEGKGTTLAANWSPAGGKNHNLNLALATELLDNRFINFSLRIWMNRIAMSNEAQAELDTLTGRVFTDTLADIKELKSK